MKKQNKEEQEAIAFSQWLSTKGYKHSHIGNESGLPPNVAMLVAIKKKKMGVSKGFPDYCIILKRGSILFLELKRSLEATDYGKKGQLLASAPSASPEQQEWIDILDRIPNVRATVAIGLKEAIRIVEESETL